MSQKPDFNSVYTNELPASSDCLCHVLIDFSSQCCHHSDADSDLHSRITLCAIWRHFHIMANEDKIQGWDQFLWRLRSDWLIVSLKHVMAILQLMAISCHCCEVMSQFKEFGTECNRCSQSLHTVKTLFQCVWVFLSMLHSEDQSTSFTKWGWLTWLTFASTTRLA